VEFRQPLSSLPDAFSNCRDCLRIRTSRRGGTLETIVGREAELAAVERFLESVRVGPTALVIEGEAGIGKTTVWLAGVAAAEKRALRVLKARPAESEARLSFAALSDLLGEAFDETRAELPAVQERALAAALLRSDTDEHTAARTTATALVGVLTALADHEPILVAIDDVQWLDPGTEEALAFAFRRLPERVGLLLARRSDPGGELPLGLERALAADRLERIAPGPLSLAALHHLVAARTGASLPRPMLSQLAESSGGNPFFALELARALEVRADYAVGEPLPVPRSLEELVAARVDDLSDAARQAALAAASVSQPTASLLTEVLSAEHDVDAALVEAEEAGILVPELDRIRFGHPLLASMIYGSASRERRRQLHKRLAVVVSDPEERARQLALSTLEPNEEIAAELERAAEGAARRGAQQAAAELFGAALRLTPEEETEEQMRRTIRRASALFAAGDVSGARSLAEQAATSPVSSLRAEALHLLGEILWVAGTFEGATKRLESALAAAPGDRTLAERVYPKLVYFNVAHDPARAFELAEAAMEALDSGQAPGALATVVISRYWAGLLLGQSPRREELERWRELEEKAGPGAPKSVLPLIHFHSVDDFDAARARHDVEDEWYRVRGEDDWRAERQAHRSFVEFRAGEWDEAERLVEASCATIARLERPGPWTMAFRFRAIVDAGRGRTERARETLLPLIDEAARTGRAHWEALMLSALAIVEFADGHHEAVDRVLTRMRECLKATGIVDYVPDRSEPFHVESLVARGETERAGVVVERLEERGRVFPRLWIDVTLPRTRALLLAAEGDVAGALAALDELDLDRASLLPLDLAWTLLVKGRLYRRARQRRAAADALAEALEIFERLGAPVWAEQTRAELERVGLRRAPKALTVTERKVAELAARGLTNREVAAAAFISPKTVEANLARVYRKLGIHSRAELGARIEGAHRPRPATSRPPAGGRELATMLFTDLVRSTEIAHSLGDAAWAMVLARHDEALRRELARFSGEEIDTAGDGFFAVFDAPARAIQCALAIREAARGLGLEVRAGVHTGEVERKRDDKPRGIAVVTCARIMSLASAGEVLVSTTTRELVAGSGLEFEDRGEQELKGIDGARRVFAAV
jgi:class 3 adenylate cyclase/ATP/maltotriose-dependent transcriptional regulator MalT